MFLSKISHLSAAMFSRGAKHFLRDGRHGEELLRVSGQSSKYWSCTMTRSVATEIQDGVHRAIKEGEKTA